MAVNQSNYDLDNTQILYMLIFVKLKYMFFIKFNLNIIKDL